MSSLTSPILLIVEDEPLLLIDVEDSLKDGGFETVTAANGKSAIAELDDGGDRFAAIVTDVDLGDGPTGWEVARHARRLFPCVPVVYMSGASHADWSAEGVPQSIMIAKPFAAAQLITAIATLINEVAPRDPSPKA